MRRHWLLVGACGWVLLILMFVTKFINFSFRIPGGMCITLCQHFHVVKLV